MWIMEAILEPLVRSPKFINYVNELNELRRREADAREQFRQSLDEDVRAEFINGEVLIQMTARDSHSMAIHNLGRLLSIFVQTRGLGAIRTEQALTGFTRNDYAPDICFWGSAKSVAIEAKTTIYPVPDMIGEVLSASTEPRDRGVKFEDYAAHGVREYWIIDPDGRVIEQYSESQGRYQLVGRFSQGTIERIAIQGLKMPIDAAFDDQVNLSALRSILS
jgi:Uma2 family endonuclease